MGWDADGKSSSLPEAVREEDGERDAASSRWLKIWGTLDLELPGRGARIMGMAVTLLTTRRLAHATWAGAGQRGYGETSTEGVSYSRWWRPFSAMSL